MGRFFNPDNSAFQKILNSEIYVDKSQLISYTNRMINTEQAFICNSRPRRFGKSVTANMLTAYYSKGCNSEELFSELLVADEYIRVYKAVYRHGFRRPEDRYHIYAFGKQGTGRY